MNETPEGNDMKYVATYSQPTSSLTRWYINPEILLPGEIYTEPLAQGRAPNMDAARACITAIAAVLGLDMLS